MLKTRKYKKFHSKVRLSGIKFQELKMNSFNDNILFKDFIVEEEGRTSTFYVRATEYGNLTGLELEAARKNIRKRLKRLGNLRVCVFPWLNVTSKPSEVRMGKGKGRVSHQVVPVAPGKLIFILSGVLLKTAKHALIGGANKLSVGVSIFSN